MRIFHSPLGQTSSKQDMLTENNTPLLPGHKLFTIAVGWFWTPDGQLGSVVGIGRTRVGYCGGKSKDPTYYNMKDHTESMQIEYDPNVITFEDLFALFTSIHNPCHVSWSVQYASIFFYNDEKEKKYAEHQFELIEKEKNKKTQTLIKPLTTFTVAEDYHQKYYFRSNPKLVKLFQLNDQ